MTADFSEPSLAGYLDELRDFNTRILQCLERTEWEQLADTLDARQLFLEKLMSASNSFSDQQKSTLKYLIKTIIDQDAEYVSRIETQKKHSSDQQLAFGRGLKALRFYQDR